ncbi:hypothetical protein Tco_0008042 [Tanacetum coccineum]
MELCTNLQNRVIDLQNIKTAQAQEIPSLKIRVKKLEKKGGSRTHKLKRLYMVGRSARVISCDEASLGDQEDASKQGRKIDDIDKDADITLVDETQGRYGDEEMSDTGVLDGDEVLAEPEVTIKDVNLSVDEVTLAQALATLKIASTRPKAKGLVIHEEEQATTPIVLQNNHHMQRFRTRAKIEADQLLAKRLQAREQEELTIEERAILFQQLLEKRRKYFAAKRAKEKRNRPPTKAQQRSIIYMDIELVKESSKKADAKIAQESSSKRAGDELEQETIKKQKVDEGKETSELKSLMEVIPDEEEVTVDAIPLTTKPLTIVDWKIHKEGKKSYYQIIRVNGSSKMYLVFSHMLKSFDREDLETLYKLVKAKYGSTRPVEDLDLVLYGALKTMFNPHVEDQVWKNQ